MKIYQGEDLPEPKSMLEVSYSVHFEYFIIGLLMKWHSCFYCDDVKDSSNCTFFAHRQLLKETILLL